MRSQTVLIVITAAIASLLEIIDSSIVNVAIPNMMGNIGATLDEISWVTTGYMISNSIVLPIAAWLGSRLGRKKYFTGAILLFTASSFACGISPNLSCLIFFRILQGMAGGALLPTSQTLIQEAFPREKAGMAMAIFGICVMVGPALGPSLGGYLTDHFGWRSIFNINVPLGILAATLAWANVTDIPESHRQKTSGGVDWLGLFFLCLGVGCFQFILERGDTEGWWDSNIIRACSVGAVTGICSFIFWELKIPNPIMNLRLFKSSTLRAGTCLMVALGVMLFSLTFAIPVFVSRVIPEMSATQTGLLFMPGSIVTAIFMLPVGILASKMSPKILAVIGMLLAEASVFSMTHVTTQSGSDAIIIPMILRGAGMAFLFIPINSMVLSQFRGEELGQVSGMQNFFRQIGGSIGIASLNTLLNRFGAQHYNDMLYHVNALNQVAYQTYAGSIGTSTSKLSNSVGMWDPVTLAVKGLYGRVQQQVFILSFQQLLWVIVVVVALGMIPLYFIKPGKASADAMMNAH